MGRFILSARLKCNDMAESRTFKLTVASVSENLFEGETLSATIPGSAGEMTILPHHEPIVTTLKTGIITVRSLDSGERKFPIQNGIFEMSGNRAVVLL